MTTKSDNQFKTIFLSQWFSECADRCNSKIKIEGNLIFTNPSNGEYSSMTLPNNSYVGWKLGSWIHANKKLNFSGKNLTSYNISIELENQLDPDMVELPIIPPEYKTVKDYDYTIIDDDNLPTIRNELRYTLLYISEYLSQSIMFYTLS